MVIFYDSKLSVYGKPTSSDIYINWNAHTTTEWKIGTLRNLIKQAKLICSDESLVEEEMKYATKVFHEVNDYRISIRNASAQQKLNDGESKKKRRAETNKAFNKFQLILQYSGNPGNQLITKMKKHIKKTLPENVQAIVTYQSKMLSTKFNVKDKTELYHQSNF